jgi:hypothetical protein
MLKIFFINFISINPDSLLGTSTIIFAILIQIFTILISPLTN